MVGCRFRSKYDHTLDEKGRLSFPSRFREVLRQYESEVLVAIPWDNHLRAYPLAEWESLENRLKAVDGEQTEDLDRIIRYFEFFLPCSNLLSCQGKLAGPSAAR